MPTSRRHRTPQAALSPEVIEARRAAVPVLRYPEGLPVVERKDEIAAAIRDHQVVVVAGETGSGKTTQLPKICLELGRGVTGTVGHTQPRRLAARTVAERISEELGTELGQQVGYAVRFTDRVSDTTLVKLMTDGILLAELQRDRLLRRYDTLIIDEAHERSLNIDFILGYLKQLLPRRPDLKVIITSATIDTERFSAHCDGAPVVEVTGRSYPVEVRYRPVGEDPDDDRDQPQAICDAVAELSAEGPGDILVFLSGEREIRDAAEALAGEVAPTTEILPLYARLSAAEQHRAFQPHSGRRIVLATNVAETSLTVPGIRAVVDPGTARISRYSTRTKVQRLPIEAVSRASANQRAGRCGRIGPGVCIRLYSEEDYNKRPEFTDPEILRTNLAAVMLQMATLRLGDVAAFPFLDPPDPHQVRDGRALLSELGAFDADERLTPIGRTLAQLPVDPRLGRMVVEGDRNGCLREVMVIAAALSIQDPRERPAEKRQAADEQHRRFADRESDFVGWLNLWHYVRQQQKALSSNQFRKRCRAEYLSHLRVREWQDIYSQLQQVTRTAGMRPGPALGPTDNVPRDALHRSLLPGLLSHIGMRLPPTEGRKGEYLGARNARFALSPGSALAKRTPRWVMAGELVETSRLWARDVAEINPTWLEPLAGHLVTRSYGGPYWDPERGAAVAVERVSLFGLPIVTSRVVQYSRVDPQQARLMFIRHALVERDWHSHHRFLADNQAAIESVEALEDRVRRRGLLADDDALQAWYAERIPPHVVSGRHFDRWWNKAKRDRPGLLRFPDSLLIDTGTDDPHGGVDRREYPDEWEQGDIHLRLDYRYEPGASDDGLTVVIPLPLLTQVRSDGFDWTIPGWRQDLVAALLRTISRDLRRRMGPVAEVARDFVDRTAPDEGPLLVALARHVAKLTGEPVTPAAFHWAQIPGWLRMTYRVVGHEGTTLASSDDLEALKETLRPHLRAVLARAASYEERSGATTWDFGSIPEVVTARISGYELRGYPALVDEGNSVGVRLYLTQEEQAASMWAGTRRLLLLSVSVDRRHLLRVVTGETRRALAAAGAGADRVIDDCIGCAADEVIALQGGPSPNREGFVALVRAGKQRLGPLATEVTNLAGAVLGSAARIMAALDRLPVDVAADLEAQVARLVYPGFVSATGYRRLPDVVRYLAGAEDRIARRADNPARDRQRQAEVQALDEALEARSSAPAASIQQVRWMIEELRISLFAQRLGTPEPVSPARIRRAIERLG